MLIGKSDVEKITEGKLRARDVRERFKNSGIDPKVSWVMEALAEANYENQKQLAAMAGAISQMVDIINNFTTVAERMKQKIIDLEGGQRDDAPDMGPVTQ